MPSNYNYIVIFLRFQHKNIKINITILKGDQMKIKIYDEGQLSYFPIYISTIGIDYEETKLVRENGYMYDQIFLVDSGTGVLNIKGKTYFLEKDDMFFIASNIPHEYYSTDNNLKTSYISFFGCGFNGIKFYYNLNDYGIYKNKSIGIFKNNVEKIYKFLDQSHELSTLCSLTFSTVISFFDECCQKQYTDIETVYNFIENNYSKSISLDELLLFYPYSKTKLCHDFKEKYKITIFEMLTKTRLNHARYMINNNPHLKLEDISLSCGFNDVSYFCKMYKRFYNHSPKTKYNNKKPAD